jgi:hypothetical protein
MKAIRYCLIPSQSNILCLGRRVFETMMEEENLTQILNEKTASFIIDGIPIVVKDWTAQICLNHKEYCMAFTENKLYHSCEDRQLPTIYGIGLGIKAFLGTIKSYQER